MVVFSHAIRVWARLRLRPPVSLCPSHASTGVHPHESGRADRCWEKKSFRGLSGFAPHHHFPAGYFLTQEVLFILSCFPTERDASKHESSPFHDKPLICLSGACGHNVSSATLRRHGMMSLSDFTSQAWQAVWTEGFRPVTSKPPLLPLWINYQMR